MKKRFQLFLVAGLLVLPLSVGCGDSGGNVIENADEAAIAAQDADLAAEEEEMNASMEGASDADLDK